MASKKKYHIAVFGCQMNRSDAERIASLFESLGFATAADMASSDIAIVVMCSVRQMATDRIFGLEQKIEQARKINSKLKIILTGCVVESDKNNFAEIFDHVLDIKTLSQWPAILAIKFSVGRTHANIMRGSDPRNPRKQGKKLIKDYFAIPPKHSSKFSALIPISKGCDNFCSYCVVPYTRGPLAPRPIKDILNEIKNAVANGAKEIWLLGQNVNNYHHKGYGFADVLRLANDIPGDFWIRFTSPHPKDFNNEAVLAMAQCQKITPYLNLPIQSGDDVILKAMKRPYTVAQYKTLVKKIRTAFKKHRKGIEKEIAISTDVIVGFPSETKAQFQNTAKAFRTIKYDMAYISRYSKRPNTAAALLDDGVPPKEKKRREEILNDIVKTTALNHNKKFIGKIVDVAIESIKNGFAFGKNRHYKTVKLAIKERQIKAGDIAKVKIVKAMPFGLEGQMI